MVTKTTLAEAAAMVRVRLLIERDVARRIAQNGLGASEDALNALIARMDDSHSEGDLVHAGETDRAFHSELATAAGVELVSPILQRCTLHIHRFTLGSVEVPREFFQESGVGAEHRKLLRALTTTDEARAEAAIVSHLRHVLSRWSPSLLKAVGKAAFSKSA
jgi:DNA-binding GntR family transcriptional regulator